MTVDRTTLTLTTKTVVMAVMLLLTAGPQPTSADPAVVPRDAVPVGDVATVGNGAGTVRHRCSGAGMKPCVRKCCTNMTCPDRDESLAASIDKIFSVPKFVNESGTVGSYEADKFNLVYGKLICPEIEYLLEPTLKGELDNFQVSEAGALLDGSGIELAQPGQFCLQQLSDSNSKISAVVCQGAEDALNVPGEKELRIKIVYTAFAMTLSLPFLFLTFLVYALIRDLRNLSGKSLMCHVASLLVANCSLVFVQLMSDDINDVTCITFAYIVQFSFIASFFWLNVMCFDLWWNFRDLKPLIGNFRRNETKKFVRYSIYAWGFTFLISIFTFYMQESSLNIFSGIKRPEFGVNSCWFNTRTAKLIYFYGPIGILLFINLLMFIHTALIIAKCKRDTKKTLKDSDSNANQKNERQRFMTYLKLFVVMGVNWLAEIVSWAFDPENKSPEWYVTDIVNSLQGVLIFFIFVCSSRVFKLSKKKFCPTTSKTTTTIFSLKSTNCIENDDVDRRN